jgi:hypothetical protein
MLAALLYFFEKMLTHARSVGKDLLRRVVGRVEVQVAVLGQAEGGSAIRLGVAGGVGVGELQEEAALGGVDGRKVDVAGGAESQDLEGSGSLGSVGSGSGSRATCAAGTRSISRKKRSFRGLWQSSRAWLGKLAVRWFTNSVGSGRRGALSVSTERKTGHGCKVRARRNARRQSRAQIQYRASARRA